MARLTVRRGARCAGWDWQRWWRILLTTVLLLSVMLFGSFRAAKAADVRGGNDVFRLGPDEVVNDDLYVAAGEIYIDGTVNGDLIAAGGYVEVNGVVTGDAMIAAGGINLNGVVQASARLVGGGVAISGKIGHDLMVAGGGSTFSGMPGFPFRIGQRTIQQGIQLTSNANIGNDAYVVGGQGDIAGEIKRNLFTGMGTVILGSKVGGDAQLYGQNVTVRNTSKVGGVLRYRSNNTVVVPAGIAKTVQEDKPAVAAAPPPPNPVWPVVNWLWRTLLISIGLALFAWVWLRVAPNGLLATTQAIEAKPIEVGLYGIVTAALILPVTAALVMLTGVFWGIFPAIVLFVFMMGAVLLLWLFSPLLTGLWLGRQLVARTGRLTGTLATLLIGTLSLVLVARLISVIPCVGGVVAALIYLLSFALALGGIVVSRRQQMARELSVA